MRKFFNITFKIVKIEVDRNVLEICAKQLQVDFLEVRTPERPHLGKCVQFHILCPRTEKWPSQEEKYTRSLCVLKGSTWPLYNPKHFSES